MTPNALLAAALLAAAPVLAAQAAPAHRVVSLAPHATELIFAAGAGGELVGVDNNSDYPAAARALPRVGSGLQPDVERILALKPDLLVRWDSGGRPALPGTPGRLLAQFGVAVHTSSPHKLADIPEEIARLGRLLGTSAVADAEARRLRAQLEALARRYDGQPPVRVFYQLGANPIYTVNDRSIISDALHLCGAVNVFGALPQVAPMVSRESVLAARPQAIVIAQKPPAAEELAASWRALDPAASAASHVVFVDPDAMNRPGPRMIEATDRLCGQLAAAR